MKKCSEKVTKKIFLAKELFKNKKYNQAISILNEVVTNCPKNADAHRNLGFMLSYSPSQDKALLHLNRAIEIKANDIENWISLGMFYKRRKEWGKALDTFHKALKLSKDNARIYYELLVIYQIQRNHELMLLTVNKLLSLEPENINYLWAYAKILKDNGEEKKAVKVYDSLIQDKWESLPEEAMEEWIELSFSYGNIKEARTWLQEMYQKFPNNIIIARIYAVSCEMDNNIQEALQIMQNIYKVEPSNPKILYALVSEYAVMGNIDKAIEFSNKIMEIDPLNISTLQNRGALHTYSYGDSFFRQLNFAAAHWDKLTNVDNQVKLHYALGKAYDDVGDLSTAFEHYKLGGALRSNGQHINEYEIQYQVVSSMISKLDKYVFQNNKDMGCKTYKPVFIVGIPRSGTSLIEQVFSTIDGVYGAGELEYSKSVLNEIEVNGFKLNFKPTNTNNSLNYTYKERGCKYLEMIERLAPLENIKIIDKMPGNFALLGLLYLILPNASFIHARRHPVETCLSAYRLNFKGGHYWSNDLKTMGKYYRLYTEIMAHWKKVLPAGTILEVRYEDMVNDLETQSKRLVEHIGMEWSEKCLEFHKSERVVRTASIAQVRKPIYKSSMNRWKKYEQFLKPLLDEIGDLVEAYENEEVEK